MYKFDCGCEIPILGDVKDNDGLPSMEIKFDEYIRPDCPATLELLASGRTKGVFQLETPLGQNWCAKLQPEHFEHISALISLLRPGCLKAITNGKSMTLHYVDRKHGREPVETISPALLPILESTYAVPVYQENSIQIAKKIAGFNLVEADKLRKAIGSKDPEIMSSLKLKFIDGCKRVGLVTPEQAEEIFGWIKESQRYSFCHSHAIEYGIISYWTAYAKAHFPVHYLCSCLAYAKYGQDPKEEVAELVEDAKYFNIDVFPPSVKSLFTGDPGYYCVNKDQINFGIGDISGVGPNHVVSFLDQVDLTEKILGKPIDKWSWLEFLIYFSCNINKTVILGLISSGFLSHMGYNRRELLYDYETFIKLNPNEVARLKDLKPTSLKDGINRLLPTIKHKGRLAKVTGIYETLINPPHKLIDDSRFIANKERELLGTPITCQALDDCDKSGANTDCKNVDSVKNPAIAVEIISAREYVIKKGKNMGKKMCYLTVKDDTCSINNVKIYSEKYGQYENMLYDGNTVLLKCYKFDDGLVINEAIEI